MPLKSTTASDGTPPAGTAITGITLTAQDVSNNTVTSFSAATTNVTLESGSIYAVELASTNSRLTQTALRQLVINLREAQ